MGKWFQWLLLSQLTGSPIGALLILGVAWWALDRFTLRILPDPMRGFGRWRRAEKLRQQISDNPADRRARMELADILLQQRRFTAAYEVLGPNLAVKDRDPDTLYLGGLAARGCGKPEEAEALLSEVHGGAPDFKLSQVKLELAEVLLRRGEAAQAASLLAQYLEKRRSSVRARVLLAQAKERLGDPGVAKQLKAEAWKAYVGLPRYLRSEERLWAWRAKPERPLMYAALGLVVGVASVLARL